MKTILLFASMLIATVAFSQIRTNIGGGYFGQTVTYPGIVLEYEIEQLFGETTSLPLRIDLGAYVHNRNNYGIFLDVNYGFRKLYKNGFMLEQSVGVGILETILQGDGVYEVDDDGNVSDASAWNPPSFMPSFTLGIGYNFSHKSEKLNMAWVRPKLYWQIPYKTSSLYTPALQVGFTHTLKTKK